MCLKTNKTNATAPQNNVILNSTTLLIITNLRRKMPNYHQKIDTCAIQI